MDFTQYQQLFLDILEDPNPTEPYDDPHYVEYVKLNWSRQQRWLKTGMLNPGLIAAVKNIKQEQFWTIITEPWCGDAAHTVPFMHMIAALNPLIKVDYQLRDSPPFLIEHYLTNGISKSVPKLIITDKNHHDLAVWGPRPADCQRLFYQLQEQHLDYLETKIILQKWYNDDRGVSFQAELLAIIEKTLV
jgi:hypothetical protein